MSSPHPTSGYCEGDECGKWVTKRHLFAVGEEDDRLLCGQCLGSALAHVQHRKCEDRECGRCHEKEGT